MPQIARTIGESSIDQIAQCVWKMTRTPNGISILTFLQALPEAARRLGTQERFDSYIDIVFDFM